LIDIVWYSTQLFIMADGVAPIAPHAAAVVIQSVQPLDADLSDNGKDRNVLLGSL
jgi:hypothetical protein